jgi:succinate dehydrogenase flavin-adding protein (antitoxin of CptAB toxin-antitoxin module)
MASIFILKQIIDLVCEELTKTKSTQYQPQSIKRFEELLEKKDEELATLYKENIKLESRIRQIESELDVFSSINPSQPTKKDEHPSNNETVEPPSSSTATTETKKEEDTKPKKKRDSEDRKQYMKEYGKKYRQRQREKKLEMNL